tara:strand:- start:582 stop:698 length:117 start_codon:yes stop_codon:yes gene_type:complete
MGKSKEILEDLNQEEIIINEQEDYDYYYYKLYLENLML